MGRSAIMAYSSLFRPPDAPDPPDRWPDSEESMELWEDVCLCMWEGPRMWSRDASDRLSSGGEGLRAPRPRLLLPLKPLAAVSMTTAL